jgi:hypothetical protein
MDALSSQCNPQQTKVREICLQHLSSLPDECAVSQGEFHGETQPQDGSVKAPAAMAEAAVNILTSGRSARATNVIAAARQAIGNMMWLTPVKEGAHAWFSSTQPWRAFFVPLSMPAADHIATRISANVVVFQTNYAMCFVMKLLPAILVQPSALFSIGVCICAWMIFLKRNEDPLWRPLWRPELWDMRPGPVQRVLVLLAASGICLYLFVGGVVVHATLVFAALASLHAILHDPEQGGIVEDEVDVEAL